MRRLLAVLLVVVVLTALCGAILVPAIQTRSAPTGVGVCDAGAACGAEYVSLSCLALDFGEAYNTSPVSGNGYQFVTSGC